MLEYEGTYFAGFQRQANALSIQAVVEEACRSLTGEPVRVQGAGRTDAGVHAMGQVVSFETKSVLPIEQVRRGLNHYLPEAIGVRAAHEVPVDFDPRRNAVSRVYRYSMLCREGRSPLQRRVAYLVQAPVDLAAMRDALAYLEGTRDFAPFSGPVESGKSTVRRLMRTAVWREGDQVHVELEGNAFLPQQVRRTVGALLQVGLKKLTIEEFKALADSGVRGVARWVAPAHGLCLRQVHYRLFSMGDYADESDNSTLVARPAELALAGH